MDWFKGCVVLERESKSNNGDHCLKIPFADGGCLFFYRDRPLKIPAVNLWDFSSRAILWITSLAVWRVCSLAHSSVAKNDLSLCSPLRYEAYEVPHHHKWLCDDVVD